MRCFPFFLSLKFAVNKRLDDYVLLKSDNGSRSNEFSSQKKTVFVHLLLRTGYFVTLQRRQVKDVFDKNDDYSGMRFSEARLDAQW